MSELIQALSVSDTQAGTLSQIAREESELKAAIIVARKFPRDEERALKQILKSCERASFAECARYKFKRGENWIIGPSVDLARECARCWGNVRYGFRIVTIDDTHAHIKGYALDLETNNLVEIEDKFKLLIYRKSKQKDKDGKQTGIWIKPDERDLRELVNRRGAICERNAMLKILPPDVVDQAMATVETTMSKAAKQDLANNKSEAIKKLLSTFALLSVTEAMLIQFLGHGLDEITEDELATLRSIFRSIKDGQARPEEHFSGMSTPNPSSEDTDELNALLKE